MNNIEDLSCIGAKECLAAFGLGVSTVSMLVFATGYSYSIGLTNIIP